jgi:hypothetical protein
MELSIVILAASFIFFTVGTSFQHNISNIGGLLSRAREAGSIRFGEVEPLFKSLRIADKEY